MTDTTHTTIIGILGLSAFVVIALNTLNPVWAHIAHKDCGQGNVEYYNKLTGSYKCKGDDLIKRP